MSQARRVCRKAPLTWSMKMRVQAGSRLRLASYTEIALRRASTHHGQPARRLGALEHHTLRPVQREALAVVDAQ